MPGFVIFFLFFKEYYTMGSVLVQAPGICGSGFWYELPSNLSVLGNPCWLWYPMS